MARKSMIPDGHADTPDASPQYIVFGKYLNYGEEDEMEIKGYKKNSVLTALTWIFIISTLGILRLIFHWWPRLLLYATHTKCHIRDADKILAIEHFQKKYKRYHVKSIHALSANNLKKVGSGKGLIPDEMTKSTMQNQQDSFKFIIPKPDGTVQEVKSVRMFFCKKLCYIWDEQTETFSKLPGLDSASTSFLHQSNGLSIFEQCQRRLLFGNNQINVEVQSVVKLLFLEVLNPFYVFQIFAISLWMSDNYYYYATAVLLMSAFGIISTILQTRYNQNKLKTTVQSSDMVTICRGPGIFESAQTEQLVPGDLIVIPSHGCTMQCDAALLSGNCIVNESMLTGESVPVTKIPLPNRSDMCYNRKDHARHTLFAGTQIVQTRCFDTDKVLAVVLRTGFLTSKGDLVRSILYPPPVDYKFEKDSYRFIAVLAGIASIGFGYSLYLKIEDDYSVRDILVDSLDLITIVVPPALPAAMTVGRVYAQRRLQNKKIYCISPRAINVSGSINCVCFDKTGTLTEEGLDLLGTLSIGNSHIDSKINQDTTSTSNHIKQFQPLVRQVEQLDQGPFVVGMAACHSLSTIDGQLVGDPLDLKMFEWTGWTLDESSVKGNLGLISQAIIRPGPNENKLIVSGETVPDNHLEIGVIRQFPFASNLQRMSVITTTDTKQFELYAKGSPEMISSLALPHTIPKDFFTTLEQYTKQGYRVIAIGYRVLPTMDHDAVKRIVREDVEKDLVFLGLVIMENRLKDETAGVIKVLKKASIRTIMVTGDNMLTAISVARECGMLEKTDKVILLNTTDNDDGHIPQLEYTLAHQVSQVNSKEFDHTNGDAATLTSHNLTQSDVESPVSNGYRFAITGSVFEVVCKNYPEILSKCLVRGTVFARMSPDQKQTLVEHLQALGYFVGMCGDGSNDCGALKAAHAGISLSEAESSVASPFTSKDPNITCIPDLIREGRCALATSFGIFKYMAVYSLTQFISVIILYRIGNNLADLQFLYMDFFLISVFALFFGRAEPYTALNKRPPSASLMSISPIGSIICHILSVLAFQILAFAYVQKQSWFVAYVWNEDDDSNFKGYENYAIVAVSAYQYITIAIVFSSGKPYRKPLITNYGLVCALIVMTAFTCYLILWPPEWAQSADGLQITPPPKEYFSFRLILIGFGACNFIMAILIEFGIVNYFFDKKIEQYIFSKGGSKSRYQYDKIEFELGQINDWPPVKFSDSVVNDTVTNLKE